MFDCIVKEEMLWTIVQESAVLIGQHGMSEDRHLCLFAGGWSGLLRFTQQRLLSEAAESFCEEYVDSLLTRVSMANAGELSQGDEDALLLNNSLIYEFPRLFPQTEIIIDDHKFCRISL